MLLGHFGVGLAIKSRYRSVPLAAILVACELPDLLLILFIAVGWEGLEGPPAHFLRPNTFGPTPFSHDISMVLIYACLAASMALMLWSSRLALAMGLGVVSHLALDLLVHAPDIGVGGPWLALRVGLDLWQRAPYVAWLLEMLIVLGGGALYLRSAAQAGSQRRAWGIVAILVAAHLACLGIW